MKHIWILLLLCLTGAACSNDVENTSLDASAVQNAESFTDPRDGHVYTCVQIGNQVWMAENLAYRLPLGVLDGCSTWNEEQYKTEDIELPVDEWVKIARALLADDSYDWAGLGVNTRLVEQMIMYAEMGYTPSEVLNYLYQSAPAYAAALDKKVAEGVTAYTATFAEGKLKEAENTNNNYSKTYGFLYTYEGAKKAVPEGWRLPTDEDWKQLEENLGMSGEDADKMNAWRGPGTGELLKASGFKAQLAGADLYDRSAMPDFSKQNEGGYFWSSTLTTNASDSIQYAVFRSVAVYTDKIWRGTGPTKNGYRPMMYSVRCVKSINKQ